MGWPQQLDVRLDGKLLKRFTVGGERDRAGRPQPATPATASRDSPATTPGKSTCRSAATRDWSSAFRSRPARTSSACRSCGSCGSRKGCRSRCSAAGSSANDQVYMDYANVGSVQIGGPYTNQRVRQPRTRRAAARFSSASRRRRRRAGLRDRILSRMARLAYRRPVTKPRRADAARVFRRGRQRRRQLRHRHSVRARAHAGRSGLPAANPSRLRSPASPSRQRVGEPASGRASAERPRGRVAAVVFPVEQHPRRSAADARRARPADEPADARAGSRGGCWPTRAPSMRWSTISPRSG